MGAMIEIERLNVSFGDGSQTMRVVDDVSFRVTKGECFGIVGESGSGKSTILRTIMGLNSNFTGRVVIDGQPFETRRTREQYRHIQMVFQDPYSALHPRRTLDWSINEPLLIQGYPDRDRLVVEMLESVGLSPALRYRFPHQLSGGQRQRVAIARAIILNPAVLLLDEPTSALDLSVQAEVLNLLDGLRRAFGLTYVFVSHELAVVAHMCDRLAVMKQGVVVEILSTEQLRRGDAAQEYTRELIAASLPYRREALAQGTGRS
jgi:peptide/nickel transport system ATP-binding protein